MWPQCRCAFIFNRSLFGLMCVELIQNIVNSLKVNQANTKSNTRNTFKYFKGSYDAISSFPFTLECFKLIV